jgi:hypothetical protein
MRETLANPFLGHPKYVRYLPLHPHLSFVVVTIHLIENINWNNGFLPF